MRKELCQRANRSWFIQVVRYEDCLSGIEIVFWSAIMQFTTKLVFIVLLLLVFSTAGWTQAIPGSDLTVDGRLIFESGAFPTETSVIFLQLNGARIASTLTD